MCWNFIRIGVKLSPTYKRTLKGTKQRQSKTQFAIDCMFTVMNMAGKKIQYIVSTLVDLPMTETLSFTANV